MLVHLIFLEGTIIFNLLQSVLSYIAILLIYLQLVEDYPPIHRQFYLFLSSHIAFGGNRVLYHPYFCRFS